LWQRVSELRTNLDRQHSERPSAIVPITIGKEPKAVEAAALLRTRGLFVPAIRYPTVPRGAARLRVTLTAAHTAGDVASLLKALQVLNLEPELLNP